MADLHHRATAPTIRRLKARADEVKDEELARLLNKLGNVDPKTRSEITAAFDRLVNKLLAPAARIAPRRSPARHAARAARRAQAAVPAGLSRQTSGVVSHRSAKASVPCFQEAGVERLVAEPDGKVGGGEVAAGDGAERSGH